MRNSTPIFRYQRAAGRCEAAEGYGRTRRGAVRPKGERVEAERELAVKREGYAPAKASILRSARNFARIRVVPRTPVFVSLTKTGVFASVAVFRKRQGGRCHEKF